MKLSITLQCFAASSLLHHYWADFALGLFVGKFTDKLAEKLSGPVFLSSVLLVHVDAEVERPCKMDH